MAGWAWLDFSVLGGQYRRRVLPFLLGVVAVAMGAAAASNLDGGVALAIMGLVATMVAGSELDPAPALGVTVAGVLATLVSGLVFGATYATMIGFPAIVASGLLIGRNRGAYRIAAEQAAALLAQRQQLEAEQRRADLLDERTRIAREIHDVLAHSLGALGIQIQAARSVLTDSGDIERAVDLLAAAQKMASEGLTETRRAVHALRTDTLPLAEELAKAAATYGDRYHVAVSLDTDGEPRPVPPDATVALLRVAQEALVNAAKHGGGKPVSVRLSFNAAGVGLTVKNALDPAGSGTPGLSTVNGGYGLTGMRERLRMLGGTLDAGQRDDGWVVAAHVPLTTRSNREPDGES
jgi:signal transduction histidine kinase